MDQLQPLTVQLLMFNANGAKETFLDAICASVAQHLTSETEWLATSAATKPERDGGPCGPYVFTLSYRALPHSFDVSNRQKTSSVISTLCDTICDPKSRLSLVQMTGGADVLFIPRHPPLSPHDEGLMRYFILASLSYSQNDQAKFKDAPRDWPLAMKAATGKFLRLGIWGISLLEYYKTFDEVFNAILQNTNNDQVQNVEVLLKLSKASSVLAPTTLPRLQALVDNFMSEIDNMDRGLTESRDNLIAAMTRVRSSVGYMNDNHRSISVEAIDESLQDIQAAILQAEDTLVFAMKDSIHKRTTSWVTGFITSAALLSTATLFLTSPSSGLFFASRMLGVGGTLLGAGSSVSTHISSNDAHKLRNTVETTSAHYRNVWALLAVVLMRNTSRDAEGNARLLERAKRVCATLNSTQTLSKWTFDGIIESTSWILREIDLASESIKTGKQLVSTDQPSTFK